MKMMKMKCGCSRIPEDAFDASNFPIMSCKKCIQKTFPWFMAGNRSDFGKDSNGTWRKIE